MKTFIFGASGALGRALAYAEAKAGSNLVLIASDRHDLEAMKSDLTLRYQIQVEVHAIDLSRTDFASGIELDGGRYYFPIGSTLDRDLWGLGSMPIHNLFQINLLSVADVISNVLKDSHRGSVDLIGFGSIAETRGRSNNVFYSASKRSLTCLFESLLHGSEQQRIRPYLFQLGYMKSQLSFGKKMLLPVAEPKDVAEFALTALNKKTPGIFYVPGFWFFVCLILKLLPQKIYRKLQF